MPLHYAPVNKCQQRLLACLAVAEIHTPPDRDLSTSELVTMYPKDVSRARVVAALRDLEAKDYVSSETQPDFRGARVLTWHISTKGLRVALGVLA